MDDAALENPCSLDAVAKATGLPVQHTSINSPGQVANIRRHRAVIDAAFTAQCFRMAKTARWSRVADGQAVILRVTEHRPVRLRSMD